MEDGPENGSENAPETGLQQKSGYGACLSGHFEQCGAGAVFPDPFVLVQRFEPILESGPKGVRKSDFGTTISRPLFDTPVHPCAVF